MTERARLRRALRANRSRVGALLFALGSCATPKLAPTRSPSSPQSPALAPEPSAGAPASASAPDAPASPALAPGADAAVYASPPPLQPDGSTAALASRVRPFDPDAGAEGVHPRALVLAPRYVWTDAAPDVATVGAVLAQAGIPYDMQPAGTDWASELARLDDYSLAIVPGYVEGAVVHFGVSDALERFARRGGVVVLFKPVGSADENQAWNLAGIVRAKRRRDVLALRFDGARPPPVSDLDSPEELTLPINVRPSPDAVEAYEFEIDPSKGTEVVAHAVGPGGTGATITRRPVGSGAIYAMGHDLATFAASHCYINCFEPSGDVLRLFLQGALREGSKGHAVVLHTVPGEASSVLLLTHDVDAPDAFREGPWGKPGALQVAEAERERGVRAMFNITTDYVTGYYYEPTVRALCDLGMCPLGAHSVTHPLTFGKVPRGTCTETPDTYGKQITLCGEVRVSRDLVTRIGNRAPRLWRSPYLELAPGLFDILAKSGFKFDSGFGIGDLPYNLPVDLSAVGFHQNRFEHARLLEFPVSCEDGIGETREGVQTRTELQASNRDYFVATWIHVLRENARNKSYTTLLLHPSVGRGMPANNLRTKVEALKRFIDEAKTLGVAVLPLEQVGDFWRARLDASLDARYDPAVGYSGTLAMGETTAAGMTLEFSEPVADFSCGDCGPVAVHASRVVLTEAPPPHRTMTFVARVK
ncbi:MAG TPA: hypothetical protein VEK07_04460 [Polyangiaceae bacterium]|nr:hypothetical protein [Polyangiaceae bacterium]